MEEKNYTGIVPEQRTGTSINAESVTELDSLEAARSFFEVAKSRLLNVNNWHKLAGNMSANFQLTDEQGREITGEAKEGCYFKIDVTGPGTKTGGGYDWVQIEAVESTSTSDVDSVGIRVRPADNPLNKEHDVAHFYSEESTSSFTVTREGKKITAAIYDRNVKPNTETRTVTDKIRDAVVGAAGIIGFSKLQWKSLAEGLVKKED